MEEILIPDIGNFDSVDVIEVLIKAGDKINKDDPLITLESDKASMDIPANKAGVIKEVKIKVGDKVKEGSAIASFEAAEESDSANAKTEKKEVKPQDVIQEKIISEPSRPAPEPPKTIQPENRPAPVAESVISSTGKSSHASPSVRRFARELGVDLNFISGSGRKNRISIEDVQNYVKKEL